MTSIDSSTLKIGNKDKIGNEVVKINQKTFIVKLSQKWLKSTRLDTLGSNFFIKENQWFVKLPMWAAKSFNKY
jgi:hypothetical protein